MLRAFGTESLDVAAALKIDVQSVNILQIGDDSHWFLSLHISVLSLHSLTPGTIRVLHHSRDKLKAVNLDFYHEAYLLAAFHLTYLDTKLD